MLIGLTAVILLGVVFFVSFYFNNTGITYDATTHFTQDSLEAGVHEISQFHIHALLIALLTALVFILGTQLTTKYTSGALGVGMVLVALVVHPGAHDIVSVYRDLSDDSIDSSLLEAMNRGLITSEEIQAVESNKPDVVLIYLESVEKAYFDEEYFPGLTPGLNKLMNGENTTDDFLPVWGSTHTIAGLVSSLCGVPYATVGGAYYQHGSGDFYMPGAQCLGDVTRQLGYQNLYYQGARLSFTRKGAFFTAHGFDQVKGLYELGSKLLDSEHVGAWGLHDDHVFDRALEKVNSLKETSRSPFLFTILSLDTHDPYSDNPISQTCIEKGVANYPQGDHKMQHIVRCTDFLISGFVSALQEKWGDSIKVYLVSDHLPLAHSRSKRLEHLKPSERTLLFSEIGSHQRNTLDRKITHLDIGATILDHITEGNISRLGMGVSVESAEKTLREDMGWEELNHKLKKSVSGLAKRLWKYPDLRSAGLTVEKNGKYVFVGEKKLPVPIMFLMDDEANIVDFYSGKINEQFELIKFLPRVIYINTCEQTAVYYENNENEESLCVLAGNVGSETMFTNTVTAGSEIDIEKIASFLKHKTNNSLLNQRLYNSNRYRLHPSEMFSAGSIDLDRLAKIHFIASVNKPVHMVVNYDSPIIEGDVKTYDNYESPSHHGFFLYKVGKGRVELLKSWRDCDGNPTMSGMKPVLEKNNRAALILMTGGMGKCSRRMNLSFAGTRFETDIKNLQEKQPFIAYLDRRTGKYISRTGVRDGNVVLSLVNAGLYNKRFQ